MVLSGGDEPRKRILCVGFSVTEMTSSYVPRAQQICEREAQPFEFHKCGIGGIGLETLAYLIDDILDMHADFRYVVFEIATGSGRTEFDQRRDGINDLALLRHVEAIASSALRRGVSAGFLNLPRLDVDYANDTMELSILAVAAVHDIPVSALSYKALLSGDDLEKFLPDKVHVNDAGAEYYARALIDLARKGLSTGTAVAFGRRCLSTSFADISDRPQQTFERHGFGVQMVEVEAGGTIEWQSGEAVELRGLTFLSGPRSGAFRVTIDGAVVGTFQSYDQYCYYERFNSRFFSPVRGRRVRIEVLPDMPDVTLLKGEQTVEPRVMAFGHLMYQP